MKKNRHNLAAMAAAMSIGSEQGLFDRNLNRLINRKVPRWNKPHQGKKECARRLKQIWCNVSGKGKCSVINEGVDK